MEIKCVSVKLNLPSPAGGHCYQRAYPIRSDLI